MTPPERARSFLFSQLRGNAHQQPSPRTNLFGHQPRGQQMSGHGKSRQQGARVGVLTSAALGHIGNDQGHRGPARIAFLPIRDP